MSKKNKIMEQFWTKINIFICGGKFMVGNPDLLSVGCRWWRRLGQISPDLLPPANPAPPPGQPGHHLFFWQIFQPYIYSRAIFVAQWKIIGDEIRLFKPICWNDRKNINNIFLPRFFFFSSQHRHAKVTHRAEKGRAVKKYYYDPIL